MMSTHFFSKALILMALLQPWAFAEISAETDEEIKFLLEFIKYFSGWSNNLNDDRDILYNFYFIVSYNR